MENNEPETTEAGGTTAPEGTKDYELYIEQIQKLRSETVSKESYEKLKEENKKLIETLTNGGTIQGAEKAPTPEEKEKRIAQLRKDLYGSNEGTLLNLDYVSKTLELRKALMEKGERDPFLPFGHNITPTEEDINKANRTAEILKECVDYAAGDSEVFTNELQRRTIDVKIPARK